MYDLSHLLYIAVTLLFMIVFSFLFKNVKPSTRFNILRVIAALAFLTHISQSVYNYFTIANSSLSDVGWTIYPYYFCNLIMLLLPVLFFGPKIFRKSYPFILWGAFFGGMITMAVPMFYNGGNIFEFGVFKSFVSHSLMIFAFIYAVISGEYKIKLKDTWVLTAGLLLSGVWGFFTNWLWEVTNRGHANSMWLNEPALEGTFFNGYVMAGIIVTLVVLTSLLVELIRKRKLIIKN